VRCGADYRGAATPKAVASDTVRACMRAYMRVCVRAGRRSEEAGARSVRGAAAGQPPAADLGEGVRYEPDVGGTV